MNLKKIGATLFALIVLNTASFAGEVAYPPFKATGLNLAKDRYITAYLVHGFQAFGSVQVSKVFAVSETQKIESETVEVPSLTADVSGFRAPTHFVVIVHPNPEHALNVFDSGLIDGLPLDFREPMYANGVQQVESNDENKKLIARKAERIGDILKNSVVLFR